MRGFNTEKRKQIQELDVQSLAKFLFRYLKDDLGSRNSATFTGVDNLWRNMFPGGPHYPLSSDYITLLEAITLLERRGLVMRDISLPGGGRSKNFIICLTSIGIKSNIDGGVILLIDSPEEIVDALEQNVGDLDPVVRQYYNESLRAFQEGLYISSVICLGAASERAIHWLAESIEPYSGPDQAGIKKRRNGHILELIKYLSNPVIPNTFAADKELAEELKKRLNGLGDVYRENRNDAGHPRTVDQPSWLGEEQEVLLLQFRRYIATICKAINYFV